MQQRISGTFWQEDTHENHAWTGRDTNRDSTIHGQWNMKWAVYIPTVKDIFSLKSIKVEKVKWSRYRHGVAQRVGTGIALLFHDRGTRRGWMFSSTSGPHFTTGKTRYPFYRRLGGPQGLSGRVENLVPTRIRSRTVQPVVSRYTDWATGSAHFKK